MFEMEQTPLDHLREKQPYKPIVTYCKDYWDNAEKLFEHLKFYL